MVAARIAYSKWKSFIQGVETAFFVLLGFAAIFFTAAPKSWNQGGLTSFSQNTAHAEVPFGDGGYYYGDGGGGGDGAGGCGGDGAGGAGGCG